MQQNKFSFKNRKAALPKSPVCKLELDRTRLWQFSFEANQRVKAILGKDALRLTDINDMAVMIWAGLSEQDRKEITHEQIASLMDFEKMYGVIEAFQAATAAERSLN